jgi:hypothetical protein
MVDQITKIIMTAQIPIHKNGEEATILINVTASARLLILKPVAGIALFLKQNWMKVSRISDRTRNESIFKVSLFLNI